MLIPAFADRALATLHCLPLLRVFVSSYVHCDIRAENIAVYRPDTVKLTSFECVIASFLRLLGVCLCLCARVFVCACA